MIGYYLDLARRSFKRNVSLTILMVVAIAFGVGASMTTLTVLHVLSADPIPGKSGDLYHVQLEPRTNPGIERSDEPPDQMTRRDSEALLRAARADHQAIMTGGSAAIEPDRAGLAPFYADARWTSADFFTMFRVPFVAGRPWNADDDEHHNRVAVIAKPLAEKLYGMVEVAGKTIRIGGNDLRVVGVIDDWEPNPHFYDLNAGAYGNSEQVYVPFSTSRELKLPRNGSMNCWGSSEDAEAVGAPCTWTQFWVELDSPAKVAAYRDFLVSYSNDERAAGHYTRPPNVKLLSVREWLDYKKVVPSDAKLQTWVALGFLLVCLINTIGLLLTKFLRRSSEIGVRRALGASKRSIFVQLLIEAGAIGIAGGVLGLGLAYLGLWAVRHQPVEYAKLAHLDLPMLAGTLGLAVVASLFAGLFPAWRGCQVSPAIQLKSH